MKYEYAKAEGCPMLTKLVNADFIVEATSNEQFFLWESFCHNRKYVKEWLQDVGFGQIIGEIEGLPVNVSVSFVKVDGLNVAFVDCISRVCDYTMMKEWVTNYNNVSFEGRRCWTNAGNFHHVVDAIRQKNQ